ncbi:MAG TPA: PstS family phosphate ABC transporter substrate-binding protein [Ignavibacteriaceae bacterium]|nr:PstS family phosphate ABC transporter substrate-binding protein [Ignavibacteriaceae bacterium]
MKKGTILSDILIILLVSSFIFIGCRKKSEAEKAVITVKGSDTMVNLSQRWAEEYMKKNPSISIQVTGGGSGTGIAALLNGTTDIANASREMKDVEMEKAKSSGLNLEQHKVALDGLAVIVSPENPISELTIAQLSDIFTGKTTNWKELGGKNLPIVLYGRENSSGTYEFFKEHVLGKDKNGNQNEYASSTQVLQGTAALGEAVARDIKGIGYGGVGYFAQRKDVKILSVKENKDSQAYSPVGDGGQVMYELIWSKKYPISRYLYCYANSNLKREGKAFLDFIVSPDGQNLVKQMEYIPLPK